MSKLTKRQRTVLRDFFVMRAACAALDVDVCWTTFPEENYSLSYYFGKRRYRQKDDTSSPTIKALIRKGYIDYSPEHHNHLWLTKHGEHWIKQQVDYSDLLGEQVAHTL